MRGTPKSAIGSVLLLLALLSACGGSTPAAEEPDEDFSGEDDNTPGMPTSHEDKPGGKSDEEAGGKKSKEAAEPEFKEGMSVDEAINAVPQGTPRIGIEPEELAAPLKDPKVYEPCKPAASAHWTIRVAIWDGKAVGLDITTQPVNKRLSECIAEEIKKITWKEKAPSLNTVEYAY